MKTNASRIYAFILVLSTLLFLIVSFLALLNFTKQSTQQALHHTLHQSADQQIHKIMRQAHIPGLSVALIEHNQVVMNKGYGYENVAKQKETTKQTRYEIASNTKAFTGLAILDLAKQGKINLDDPVSKYVPWLHFKYHGHPKDVTLKMLMAQTSGISDELSEDKEGEVPEDLDNIEGRVKGLNHASLKTEPGKTFNYANNNYNILGLVVQNVTQTKYEDYMHQHFLAPLHMNHSTFKTDDVKGPLAQGYVYENQKVQAEDPDYFRGDTPAAYLISSTTDLIPFVKMNLQPSQSYESIIKKSHQPLAKVPDPSKTMAYATGWFIDKTHDHVQHPGTLPNYSSMIMLDTKQKNAVILLANLNSPKTPELAATLMQQLDQYKQNAMLNQAISKHPIVLTILLTGLSIIVLLLLAACIRYMKLIQNKHVTKSHLKPNVKRILLPLSAISVAIILYLTWCAPSWFVNHSSWQDALYSFPAVLTILIALTALMLLLIVVYSVMRSYFKPNNRNV